MLVLSAAISQGQILPAPPPPPPMAGQPRDVDRRAEPVGTGVIRGRVVAGDTGNPVRRAQVNLQPVMPAMPPPGTRIDGTGPTGSPTRTVVSPTGAVTIAGPNTIR